LITTSNGAAPASIRGEQAMLDNSQLFPPLRVQLLVRRETPLSEWQRSMRGKQALNGRPTLCAFATHFDVDPN
jgi:hypothetical protein